MARPASIALLLVFPALAPIALAADAVATEPEESRILVTTSDRTATSPDILALIEESGLGAN